MMQIDEDEPVAEIPLLGNIDEVTVRPERIQHVPCHKVAGFLAPGAGQEQDVAFRGKCGRRFVESV